MKNTPSPNVLMQMFGSDEPIGAYAEETYKENLKESTTFEEAVWAVIKYAEDLHAEQERYDRISPYGGFDITVEYVAEIALGQTEVLKENYPDIDVEVELIKALKKAKHPFVFWEDIKRQYEEAASTLEQLPEELNRYQKQISEFEKQLEAYRDEFVRNLEIQITPLDERIQELDKMHNEKLKTENPFVRLARKRSIKAISKRIDELEEKKIQCYETCEASYQETCKETRERLDEYEKFACPIYYPSWLPEIEQETQYIYDKKGLSEAQKCISSYINNPEIQTRYKDACRILSEVEDLPPQFEQAETSERTYREPCAIKLEPKYELEK